MFLDLLDEKYFTNEQIEFLDKFFKDNPWADNAQIESIVKQTGLTDSIIKVKISFFNKTKKKSFFSYRCIWNIAVRNGIASIHQIIIRIIIPMNLFHHKQ